MSRAAPLDSPLGPCGDGGYVSPQPTIPRVDRELSSRRLKPLDPAHRPIRSGAAMNGSGRSRSRKPVGHTGGTTSRRSQREGQVGDPIGRSAVSPSWMLWPEFGQLSCSLPDPIRAADDRYAQGGR